MSRTLCLLVVGALSVFGFAGCTEGSGTTTLFEVKVENISTPSTAPYPVVFSPVLSIVHNSLAPIYAVGEPARQNGLEPAVEDGDFATLLESLQFGDGVTLIGVATTPIDGSEGGGLASGKTFRIVLNGDRASRLSFITVFLQGNDLFVGTPADGIPLFDAAGAPLTGDITSQLTLFEAGTEQNQPPGSGPDQVVRQTAPNTGAPESAPVAPVNDGFSYPSVTGTLRVTIAPIGESEI